MRKNIIERLTILNVKCMYCGKKIIDQKRPDGDKDYSKVYRSSEHIIQNALGGRLESESICCDRCNFHLEELVDKKFCDIFAPFVSDIKNFRKTNNANSEPKYSGHAMYSKESRNKIVRAEVIKQSKVKKSQEIIDIEKEDGTENLDKRIKNALKDTKVLFNNFNLNNEYFKQGFSKIAYNYAAYSGIDVKDICEKKFGGQNNELLNIKYKTKVIPYIAGNQFDEFVELRSDFFLFHNLILFSYENTLWCYVNLFNTFQFYVMLSDNYTQQDCIYKILGEEFQYVQSNMPYEYNSYSDVIIQKAKEYAPLIGKDMSYNFYIRNNEVAKNYRIVTPLKYYGGWTYQFILYPSWIVQAQDKKLINISDYTVRKYIQLNKYTLKDKLWLTDEEIQNMSISDRMKVLDLFEKSIQPNV